MRFKSIQEKLTSEEKYFWIQELKENPLPITSPLYWLMFGFAFISMIFISVGVGLFFLITGYTIALKLFILRKAKEQELRDKLIINTLLSMQKKRGKR